MNGSFIRVIDESQESTIEGLLGSLVSHFLVIGPGELEWHDDLVTQTAQNPAFEALYEFQASGLEWRRGGGRTVFVNPLGTAITFSPVLSDMPTGDWSEGAPGILRLSDMSTPWVEEGAVSGIFVCLAHDTSVTDFGTRGRITSSTTGASLSDALGLSRLGVPVQVESSVRALVTPDVKRASRIFVQAIQEAITVPLKAITVQRLDDYDGDSGWSSIVLLLDVESSSQDGNAQWDRALERATVLAAASGAEVENVLGDTINLVLRWYA